MLLGNASKLVVSILVFVGAAAGCQGAVAQSSSSKGSTSVSSTGPTGSAKTTTTTPPPPPPSSARFAFFAGSFGPSPSTPIIAFGELAIDPTTGEVSLVASAATNAVIAELGPLVPPDVLAVSPAGDALAIGDGLGLGTGTLLSFSIDPTTGAVAQTQPPAILPGTAAAPWAVRFAGNDTVVVSDRNGMLSCYGSSVSSLQTPVAQNFLPISVAVVGSFVYESFFDVALPVSPVGGVSVIGSTTPSNVFIATIGPGGQLTAGPVIAETLETGVYAAPSGKFVYLEDMNGVTVCTPDPKTGALTPGAHLALGQNVALAFTPSGDFAYAIVYAPVVPTASAEITVLSVNPTTGDLTPGATLTIPDFLAFVVDCEGKFAYVTTDTTSYASYTATGVYPTSFDSTFQAYAIDAQGGLTASGNPLTLTAPSGLLLAETIP